MRPARRLLPLALAVLAAAALAAPAADAGPAFTIGHGRAPHLVVVPATGALHAVWVDDPEAQTVHYCRVTRGATRCGTRRDLVLGVDGVTASDPFVLREPDGVLRIVTTRYVGADAWSWRSDDDGATWTGPTKLYAAPNGTDHGEPILGPGTGRITFASWNPARSVFRTAADGSQSSLGAAAIPDAGGDASLRFNFAVAPTGDGGLVATADTLAQVAFWRLAPGADPNQTAAWSPPTPIGPGSESRVAGGPGGAYVLSQRLGGFPRTWEVRHWAGAAFGAPVAVGTQTGYVPDLHVGPSGVVVAVWRENGTPNLLRAAFSTNRGASFGAPITASTDAGLFTSLDAALAQDAHGFAVWQGDGKTIRAAALDPAGTSAPAPPTRETVGAVPGARLRFGVPKGCVMVGSTYRVTLKWRRQKRKGNVFVKIRRTDFYVGSKIVARDLSAPFVRTLKVRTGAQRGVAIRLRARAFIKVRRGRGPKKSILATIRVCP